MAAQAGWLCLAVGGEKKGEDGAGQWRRLEEGLWRVWKGFGGVGKYCIGGSGMVGVGMGMG